MLPAASAPASKVWMPFFCAFGVYENVAFSVSSAASFKTDAGIE
jgi:hypothetical protein